METFADLKYVRPDMSRYEERIRKNTEHLKNAKDYESFQAAYLDYVQAGTELETANTIAYIRNTMNLLDPYYEGEMAYFNAEFPKYGLLEKDLCEAVLKSPFKANLEEEFGSVIIKNMEVGNMLSDEKIVEDLVEESNLTSRYMKTQAAATVNFRGESLGTYGLLKHMQSTDREERKEAFFAWADLYESIAPELDEIYDGLVKVRDTMAKKLGFESYIPMAYLRRGRYDYQAEDLITFRKQVREWIVPAAQKLYENQRDRLGIDTFHYYDESLNSPDGNAVPIGNKDDLVEEAGKMYRELSKESGEFFDFMLKYQLFDLETRHGKRAGGYCTSLPLYHAPFIFSNFNGTDADVNVLTHEAGHAFAGFTAAKFQKLPELCYSTSEISEIHSMSMEFWTYPWMEKFFGDKAENYRRDHLTDALCKIPYIVCVDEFQHRVFENPSMTAMARRELWRNLEKIYMPWRDYDGNRFLEEGGFWMQKQHIFLYPFYYVDYAMAQMGAFEFYTKMKKDRTSAWKDYYRLCAAGGSMGYFKLLEYAGLHNVLKEGSVEEILTDIFEELNLCQKKE